MFQETFISGGSIINYFFKNDDRAESRGFVERSFMRGLNLTDFIFHALLLVSLLTLVASFVLDSIPFVSTMPKPFSWPVL